MSTQRTDPQAEIGQLSELTQRALEFYDAHLKAILEPEHDGEGLAIHPDTGDYLLAPTPTEAGRVMFERHPDGRFLTLRVGPTPEYALAARLLGRHATVGTSK